MTATGVGNRRGYSGYESDSKLAGNKCHGRNRVFAPDIGVWLSRDQVGYLFGFNLYGYVNSRPTVFVDPSGTTLVDIPAYPGNNPVVYVDGRDRKKDGSFERPDEHGCLTGGGKSTGMDPPVRDVDLVVICHKPPSGPKCCTYDVEHSWADRCIYDWLDDVLICRNMWGGLVQAPKHCVVGMAAKVMIDNIEDICKKKK
jgi:RHS repeat-associated protein